MAQIFTYKILSVCYEALLVLRIRIMDYQILHIGYLFRLEIQQGMANTETLYCQIELNRSSLAQNTSHRIYIQNDGNI